MWYLYLFFIYRINILYNTKMKRFGNIPYNLTFTTTLMITIISWDYLNLSVANECVGDVIVAIRVM